ncbi:carbonic anhydrase [Calothrix sp. 336/3]|uniref:carbonic anhydrase n=1 Tax=Calothrix sp. 336/3 TaxID=1337936 RepID=UPI0004E33650|nr:carbonic anhydrase [Calothrix sp. 336/3]AKG20827.1 carbonic anhydrase [Calothrix sp. 336/3]
MSRINGFVGRRNFFKLLGIGSVAMASSCQILGQTKQSSLPRQTQLPDNLVNYDTALNILLDGNQRFVKEKRLYPDQSFARVKLVAQTQYPFAAILDCADSRVPTEIIFDQGIGDLFVVRVAGNIANDVAIGSLEYAASVLGCQLIMVLGHERCGAVAEALKSVDAAGNIDSIIDNIQPGLKNINKNTNDALNDAVIANIQYQLEKIKEKSSILLNLVNQGKLKIIGARYDLDTGKVAII